jgi:hypothetical protein
MRITIARIGATGAGAVLALGLFAAAPPAGASSSGTHGVNSADSTCFTATGHTQGRSHSDPDGMSNGGADKRGCDGGINDDRDGNNGCGNDTDREDDNNGWCGRKPKGDNGTATTPPPAPPTSTTTTTTTAPPPATVSPQTAELTDCQIDAKEATDCSVSAQVASIGARLSVAATAPAPAAQSGAGSDVAGSAAGSAAAGTPAAVAGETTTSTTAPGTQVLGLTQSRGSSLPRTGAAVGGLALLGLGLVVSGRLTVLARRLLRIG